MKNLVLITHAGFAAGIISSLELVMGPVANVGYVSITAKETIEEITAMIRAEIEKTGAGHPTVLISDIAGGSTTQAALKAAAEREHTYLITGLNLGLLLEAAMMDLDEDDAGNMSKLQQAIENSKSMMYLIDHEGLASQPESGDSEEEL